MKKILLLTTGGTIACTKETGIFRPSLSGRNILSFVPDACKEANIDIVEVLNIDSSNMQPGDWVHIAKTIKGMADNYDGIVVLHGTDTMAYTTSAISFMTIGNKIPIVFTGSQLPIAFAGSDAEKNLQDAILVACYSGLQGVYLVFNGKIMNGCCVSKSNSCEPDAFQSINCQAVGVIDNKKISLYYYPQQLADGPQWHMGVCSKVLLWKLTPGIDPCVLDDIEGKGYKVLILEAFGVGGIPMLKNNFLPKIIEWKEKGILTVVTTQCYQGKCDTSIYEVGKLAMNKGAICAGNMTREALVAKLMWILSITNDADNIIEMLRKNFCGEFGG